VRHLPGLDLKVDFPSRFISVGDTIALTITVRNQATDPGENLNVTLPVPPGVVVNGGQRAGRAVALPSTTPEASPTTSATPGASPTASPTPPISLTWSLSELPAASSASFTATMRLTSLPQGGALVFSPQVTADGLDLPISKTIGVVVVDHSGGPNSVQYTPGSPVTLHSSDNQVTVDFPAGAYTSPLTLQHSFDPPSGANPPPNPGIHRSFDTFYLTATDQQGRVVHQFAQPLTITVGYTAEQLRALNIVEGDLQLSYYDEVSGRWQAVPSTVDVLNHQVAAQVNHFTGFHLIDGSSPSTEFIPSLQGWQVDLYSGGLSYSYPIAVPAGPHGLKPSLNLSYNSTSSDGKGGQHDPSQADWVGKDWSLDSGSIALNMTNMMTTTSAGNYTLIMEGQSYDLLPECPTSGYSCQPGDNPLINPTGWRWSTANDAFLKIQVVTNGLSDCSNSNSGHGGCLGGVQYPRYKWQVWSKGGTLHEFAQDIWWGWYGDCLGRNHSYMETYKWQLSKVVDVYGNTINYNYQRPGRYHNAVAYGQCPQLNGTIDTESWLTSITWGAGTSARYQVIFNTSQRGADRDYDNTSELQILDEPHQTQQLDSLVVKSSTDGNTWQQVSQYNLAYDYSTCDDHSRNNGDGTYSADGGPKLTLTGIRRLGNGDTGLALPRTALSYGLCTNRGSGYYPNGEWNRLNHVDNSQGGTLDVYYDTIGGVISPQSTTFVNNRRVNHKVLKDGMSHDGQPDSYTFNYSYQHPAYNWLGRLTNQPAGEEPNSASVYYDTYDPGIIASGVDTSTLLVHAAFSEFRGHSVVTETQQWSGNYTVHYFYQGEAPCYITTDPNNASCPYVPNLRDRDPLKGKEYKAESFTSAGVRLSGVQHSFQVCTNDLGEGIGAKGIWRSFNAENQTIETSYDSAGANPRSKTTNYSYDVTSCRYDWPPNPNGPTVYGNLTRTEERGADSALLRYTTPSYATRNDSSAYIVDRKQSEDIFDGQGRHLGLSFYLYDGNNTNLGALGIQGSLTRVMKFYNVPLQGDLSYVPLYSSDTTYTYDQYGNQASVTTYTGTPPNGGAGSAEYVYGCNGMCWILSNPGNGGTMRITSTYYDQYFHALPVQIDHPLSLTEYASYDWRMGTITQVIDYNGNATNASYDELGRMTQLIKPGDNTNFPTEAYWYYNYGGGQPFKYSMWKYENASHSYRPIQQFYDGLGRLVQTKSESQDLTQNIVTDKVYDGLSQVVKESQPRYVSEGMPYFGYYTAIADDNTERWTRTQYDALGRPITVTAPDNSATSMSYGSGSNGPLTTIVDAGNHQKQMEYDVFGRLSAVREYTGTGSFNLYATTLYTYNPLDLLTNVRDQQNNTTSISYDTLGRKTQMTDPDMGTWQYQYDVNGNLTQQLDAKSQTITFGYDAIDRLLQKSYSTGDATAYYRYDEAGVPNGKGQRTSMSRASANAAWQYDARGRASQALYQVISNSPYYSYQFAYDSADRLTTLTYPTGEALTYAYDAGWRQTSVCSNLYGCYATAAGYSALNQPVTQTLGSGVVVTYTYQSPMSRLGRLQVTAGTNSLFDRSYGYDNVGNVQTIINNLNAEQQTYGYDPLDRLTNWDTSTSVHEQYVYDAIGNLTSKAGTAYIYGATNNGPHQARTVGGQTYSYDNNGNLQSGGGRNYVWNAENQPSSISYNVGANTDSYSYDADGERVSRSVGVGAGQTTTYYIGGLYEFDSVGNTRLLYQFGGQTVAQRTIKPSGANNLYYLHGDHLGSVSLMTGATGNLISSQEFKPWGEVRSGGVSLTTLNYTGQRKDDTGLLYYHARYYDPVLARFISGDAIVPDGTAVIVTDYHEPGLLTKLNRKNQTLQSYGFPFQSDKSGDSSGPTHPQNLNRYSYVADNPLMNSDPTGHSQDKGGRVYNRSHRKILVYGSIPWEKFQEMHNHDGSCTSMSDCLALYTAEAQKYGWHLHDGTSDGNNGQIYVQGWFELDPGKGSYEDLGMVDADIVMAYDGDKLAHCTAGYWSGCGGGMAAYSNKEAEFKISNVDTATITDGTTGNYAVITTETAGLFGGRDPWYLNMVGGMAPRGWKKCDPNQSCLKDPYYDNLKGPSAPDMIH